MKKQNLIFSALFLTLSTMPSGVSALTVSGTVVDETGKPLIGATVKDSNTKKAVITDINGNFTLNSENKSNLEISYIGYKTQTVTPQEKLNITLVEDSKVLGEVVETVKADITGKECVTKEQAIQAAEEEARKQHTKPEEIQADIRDNSRRPAYLVDEHANKEAKGKYKKIGTEWICVPNECIQDYKLEGNVCVKYQCSQSELKAANATGGKVENGQCVPVCDEDKNFRLESGKCICKDTYTLQNGACVNADILAEKQKAYNEAKAKEQSNENKLLGGLTTAATGIGTMELMQGMAEQSVDKDAAADMAAYIETMRCTYGDGKQVKAGPEEIELPGANDAELMKLRNEYLALAQDLKERKEALGLKPGIESEVIVDRAQTGLYDDENLGITSGNYASLYRAQALNNEADQQKIADQQKTSANRVKGGAIAAGAGVVVGVAGNSLINGKLGEMLKSKKSKSETEKLLEKEADALKDLQSCLKDAGIKDTDKLEFANFYPSVLSVKKINCKSIKLKRNLQSSETVNDIFADSADASMVFDNLAIFFDTPTISTMIGYTMINDNDTDRAKAHIKTSIESVQKKMNEAVEKDKSSGIDLGDLTGKAKDLLGNTAK